MKLGYLVVFRYKENSHFHVLIFDPSATKVDYPSKRSNGHEEGQCDEEDTDESDASIQILPNCPLRPKRRDTSFLPRWKKIKTTSTSGRIRRQKSKLHVMIQQLTRIEKAKALKKASGFKSKNPHFMVVMQLSFVKAWYLVSYQFKLNMHKHNVVEVLLVYSTNEYNAIYLVQCIPV